jgi:hypothetical protein
MATWKGDVWLGSASGRQTVTVQSNTSYGAKEQMATGINFGGNTDGYGVWICILGTFILFALFTPWVLMGFGGAIGWWFGEKVTGMKGIDYAGSPEYYELKNSAIILALSLLAGGFGFVQGDNLQKEFNSDVNIEEVRSK